jgi:hypothetical protein
MAGSFSPQFPRVSTCFPQSDRGSQSATSESTNLTLLDAPVALHLPVAIETPEDIVFLHPSYIKQLLCSIEKGVEFGWPLMATSYVPGGKNLRSR